MTDFLDEIEARWAAATRGPWVHVRVALSGGATTWVVYDKPDNPRLDIAEVYYEADATAIARAPEDIARLGEEVKALRAQAARDARAVEAAAAYIAWRRAAAHVLGPALERMAMKEVAAAYDVLRDAALAARKGE